MNAQTVKPMSNVWFWLYMICIVAGSLLASIGISFGIVGGGI